MRIGIKVGSKLITDGKKKINWWFIFKLCWQISKLIKLGHEVFLVTSGAIRSDHDTDRSENLRAGVGQVRLIFLYALFFKVFFGINIAQILFTDNDLFNDIFDKNRKLTGRELVSKDSVLYKTLTEAFFKKVVPILNYNDTVDDKEIKAFKECADNDNTAKWISMLLEADLCIIGFDKPGLLDKQGKVIYQIKQSEREFALSCAQGGNSLGHGAKGGEVKTQVCCDLAAAKIKTILVPGKEKNFILRAVAGENNFGTIFLREEKRWKKKK